MTESSAAAGMIEATRRWIAELVVGESLCPFAQGLLEAERVGIAVAPHGDLEGLLHALADEAIRLSQRAASELETTLLLHPGTLEGFDAQLDFLAAVEALLDDLKLGSTLQVVSFHPDYRFEDAAAGDPANYTNRSPFAMFHLLRRRSVEAATDSHPDPDSIWRRNVDRLRELGAEELEAKLQQMRSLANAAG